MYDSYVIFTYLKLEATFEQTYFKKFTFIMLQFELWKKVQVF